MGLPYEAVVGWRYLVRPRRRRLLAAIGLGGAAALLATLAVIATGAKLGLATVALLVLGVLGAAVGLANFFSVFTTVSIVGVVLGVAALTVVLSVTSGFEEEFKRKILGVNAHVIVLKYGVDFSEYRAVMKQARAVEGVRAAAPFVFNEMMIARGDELSGVLIKGVDPALVGEVLDLPRALEAGSIGALAPGAGGPGPPGIIIGRVLAEKLGARLHDPVRLVSPLASLDPALWSSSGQTPRAREFRVEGIFYSGFDEYDRRLVYVSLGEAQAFFEAGDVVSGVELKLADVGRARQVARALERQLGDGPYKVIDWRELNHNLFAALQVQKVVISLCLGLIIVVAMFNIVAALTMMVLQKVRAVAILQSMGTPAFGIARVFQVVGMTIGAIGTLLGCGLGWLLCLVVERYRYPLDPKVYLIDRLPVRIDPREFALAAAATLVLCLVATLYPALRAAALDPVEGLRYE